MAKQVKQERQAKAGDLARLIASPFFSGRGVGQLIRIKENYHDSTYVFTFVEGEDTGEYLSTRYWFELVEDGEE